MIQVQPTLILNNGARMPVIGLGTSEARGGEVRDAVEYALDVGYRSIDTGFAYGNEMEIGQAINKKIEEGVVKREDIFITTKLWSTFHRPDKVIDAVKKSLENLKLDYLDLYLIHNPVGFKYTDDKTKIPKGPNGEVQFERIDHSLIWKELEKTVDQGMVKAIGLSNFNIRQIQHVLDDARITPANLQVECHAFFRQEPLFQFCKRNNITFTAFCPLGSPARKFINANDPILLDQPQVLEIAKRHTKTPAQILIRYLIERGRANIPKSVHGERILENFEVMDFSLTSQDLEALDSMDRNLRYFLFEFINDSPDFPFAESS